MINVKFTKMQGAGNDYVYVDCTEDQLSDPGRVAKIVSDRHYGIGSDGLILIKKCDGADFFMEMYNADGTMGGTCGNGLRCVGKYVYENGLTDKTEISIKTPVSLSHLSLNIKDGKVETVSVNMGRPEFSPELIPVRHSGENAFDVEINIDGKSYDAVCLSMGNPHCVVFMKDIDSLDIEKIGPMFENNEIFPERTNTEFIEPISDSRLKMRVWERGAGETLACGTGACAALVAGAISGVCGKEADVILRGGTLHIKWDNDGYVHMTGDAVTVFTGEIDI